ncbi:chitobiosyldiphosphodolichol beta-mannosyltransferase isoform X1 [Hetaerina americana]|uniref:chitobiosyldiphosphodolichol beta-mannosyltransferase isoform X1 n=1 Tax=Hetaerina americana TaxID=62018 RepID=UPI003A7F216E
MKKKRCCFVVVLGDVGRSPRMQYHALSLAREGFNVDVVGYEGSKPIQDLIEHPNVKIRYISSCPSFQNCCPRLLSYLLKIIWQTITLHFALLLAMFGRRSLWSHSHLLLQNPPGIPAIAVAWLHCRLIGIGCHLIVDWHNYGHTIMAIDQGGRGNEKKSLVVRIAGWLEGFLGRRADAAMCVTNAMRRDLLKRWGIRAKTVYDRPPASFKSLTLQEKHELFLRLSEMPPEEQGFISPTPAIEPSAVGEASVFGVTLSSPPQSPMEVPGPPPPGVSPRISNGPSPFSSSRPDATVFTERYADGRVILRSDRPGLLVSSTSWTPDEDFSILLGALAGYEKCCNGPLKRELPPLLVVVTGRGPQRSEYIAKVAACRWRHVQLLTPWLPHSDYPKLLASADLGVCLHTSSSGLDLPMKVVDMFGCGLPVCAYKYQCLDELVEDGSNGMTFTTSEELTKHIIGWFKGFPWEEDTSSRNEVKEKNQLRHETFRKNVEKFGQTRWHDNWKQNALPLFL